MSTSNTSIINLLGAAAGLLDRARAGSTDDGFKAAAELWTASYETFTKYAKLSEENAELRARLYAILDSVRDLVVTGTDFPDEVNAAYNAGAPIFGLPSIDDIEKAEDAGDDAALAKLAEQQIPFSAPVAA